MAGRYGSMVEGAKKMNPAQPSVLNRLLDAIPSALRKTRRIFSRSTISGNPLRIGNDIPTNSFTPQQAENLGRQAAGAPVAFTEAVGDAADVAAGVRQPEITGTVPTRYRSSLESGKYEPNSGRERNVEEKKNAREEIAAARLGESRTVTTGRMILGASGLALTGMMIYAGVITDNTDGETAYIKNMTIDNDNRYATINYSQPSDVFRPAEGDAIALDRTGLEAANDCPIVEIVSKSTIRVDLSVMANRPPRGTKIVEDGRRLYNLAAGESPLPNARFVCYSDFGNQLGSAIDDLLGSVGDAVGSAVGVGIDEFGNIVNRIVLATSPIIQTVTRIVTDAGTTLGTGIFSGIGDIFEGMGTTLLIVIIVIIIAIIAVSLTKKS